MTWTSASSFSASLAIATFRAASATRNIAGSLPSSKAGSHTLAHLALDTFELAAIVSSAGVIGIGFLSWRGSAAATRRLPPSHNQSSAASSRKPSRRASTICSRSSSMGTPRLS